MNRKNKIKIILIILMDIYLRSLASKIILNLSNLKGGVYSKKIESLFEESIKKLYEKNKLNFSNKLKDLGGIYIIEGDFRIEDGEYYKIGMSKNDLIDRIDSYGTYYPFGVKIRGISFSLPNIDINLNHPVFDEIMKILNNFHNDSDYDKYYLYYKSINKNISEKLKNTKEYYDNYVAYEYIKKIIEQKKKKNILEEKINFSILKPLLYHLQIKSLESLIHNKLNKFKNFDTKTYTRKKYGEFFKISLDELVNVYLDTTSTLAQLFIYFYDEPLIFCANPEKIPKFRVYLGSKKI